MRLDADRAHAGAAAAMRNAEGLVQVQMTDIRADVAGAGKANHRIHVGAVQIDLAAVLMHDLADLADVLLEHAVRRGIGDHAAGEGVRILLRLGAEVVHVDLAGVAYLDDHHLHAGHLRRGRIRAVRRCRYQADVAMCVAVGDMIGADREQTGIFTLGTRVRLHRDRIITGDRAELLRQVFDQMLIAECLVGRHEGMDFRKLRPGDRQHFRCRVELHRAGAEGDHRAVERQIAIGEAAHVARHLALGAVHVKDRMGEIGAGAQQFLRQAVVRFEFLDLEIAAEGAPDGLERDRPRTFVETDADPGRSDLAKVYLLGHGGFEDDALQLADFDGDRIEEDIRFDGIAELFQSHGKPHRLLVHALGDRL